MSAVRGLLIGILLLAGLRLSAQDWELLPAYGFRPGGRAQVRRIIWCEDYERTSPGFVKLRDSTSIDELLRLAQRHNPALQLYAAMALADRHYPRLHEVFARLIRKDRPIRYSNYRFGTEHISYLHASEHLYHRIRFSEAAARSHLRPAFPSLADSLQYETIVHRMDSVAIRMASEGKHVHYTLLANCLEHNRAYPGYASVRQLCSEADPQKWQNRGYATALAAYQRESDVKLLLTFEQNAFAAIGQFPHQAFWPLLEKYSAVDNSFQSYEFYQAITAFTHPRAVQLVDSILRFQIKDVSSASNMAQVLLSADAATFCPAAEQLWVQHHSTRSGLVTRFIQRNPIRAAEVFAAGFRSFKAGDQGHYTVSDYEKSDSLVVMMLRSIRQQDSAAFRVVGQHLVQVARWHELTALCRLDKQYRLSWLRPLLTDQLRASSMPFDQYMIASNLFDYNDAATTTMVKQILGASAACQTSSDVWCHGIERWLGEPTILGPAKN